MAGPLERQRTISGSNQAKFCLMVWLKSCWRLWEDFSFFFFMNCWNFGVAGVTLWGWFSTTVLSWHIITCVIFCMKTHVAWKKSFLKCSWVMWGSKSCIFCCTVFNKVMWLKFCISMFLILACTLLRKKESTFKSQWNRFVTHPIKDLLYLIDLSYNSVMTV